VSVRFKGVAIELGGAPYVLPPLSLGALEDFEQRLESFSALKVIDQVRLVVDLVHRALRRNYPELTRDEVRELVDTDNAFDLFAKVLSVSGLTQGEADAGNPRATATHGTGSPSTPTSPPVSDGPSSTAATASP
jgi:hypothetical protein